MQSNKDPVQTKIINLKKKKKSQGGVLIVRVEEDSMFRAEGT